MVGSRNGRFLTTDSNNVDEPFKVEEAETVDIPPPPTEKVTAVWIIGHFPSGCSSSSCIECIVLLRRLTLM